MLLSIFAAAFALLAGQAPSRPIPTRTPLDSVPIVPMKGVTHVETMRVDFLPGQEMPAHMHPVPVVCIVSRGSLLVSIGAAPIRGVKVGDATLEPPGQIVHYFRNMSMTEPAQLYCTILAGPSDKQYSVMLAK
jgi:quercetin dioxygenase-like cupin family protein